jgi:cleavage stimulation factor subunit 3
MAEYDPAGLGAAWGENECYGVADGNQQEHTQHSTQQETAEYSVDIARNAPGDGSSHDGPADDVGDHDPASVQSAPEHEPIPQTAEALAPVKPSKQAAAKKPRTAGGFLVGDSDSEDDGEPIPASSGPAQGSVAQSSISQSSLQQSKAAKEHDGAPSNTFPASQANVAAAPPAKSFGNGAVGSPAPGAAGGSASHAPPDRLASLEARVSDDPRGALDEWLSLIAEYRARNNLTEIRQVYERFLVVFPQAADIWAAYLDLELSMNNFPEAEAIFGKSLMGVPNVNLWTKYLDYIRRRNDLNDSTGQARQTVSQAYDFVIDNIGLDKDSGNIWADYIQFLKLGPGTVGGSQWQDQQKMDQLRKAYQKAICVPIANVNALWKEYDQFEMGLNKLTGRKYLAEKSPSYMSAKGANTALDNITRGLSRTSLPRLPPAPGFDGDQEFMEQVEIWKRWISWEKSDPLDLKEDKEQPGLYHKRILYVYNQALMALRFWPEMWVDAAQWCLDENVTTVENKVTKDGKAYCLDYLLRGIEANPESILLALKHADYIESTHPIEENDDAKHERGEAVKAPYNKVLDTLYAIIKRLKDRETAEIARIEAAHSADATTQKSIEDDDDDDPRFSDQNENRKQEQIRAIQQGSAAQTQVLSRSISFVWIALIRAMRRIQGKGKPGTKLGGMRQAFTDARARGRLTSDVYAAVAQLEWTIYKDPAGGKIFDRGARLFPEDENFTLENIKYLHSRDDFTNARVLFETVVNRLTQKPETVHKSKVLYAYFHKYESQFGELSQIAKLEKRMAELFPEDPKLATFSARYSTEKFDPIAARIIVSPATQLRPKSLMLSIEQPASIHNSPRPLPFATRQSPHPQFLTSTDSPKRPLAADDFDEPPRKIQRNDFQEFQRGASPLKGAAGRRLDQQRRMQGQGAASYTAAPAPIARDITFLMSVIPRAETYDYHRINPTKMVNLIRDTVVPDLNTWKNNKDGSSNVALRGGHGPSHNRQVSSDYPTQYGFNSRDSPAPQGRPMSPYTGDAARGRLAPASATYRQSSLRPGSSGSYEPPPAGFSQTVPPPAQQYNRPPAPVMSGQFDTSSWQQPAYGAPPPQAYGAPPPNLGYGQAPPTQQPGYPQYRY